MVSAPLVSVSRAIVTPPTQSAPSVTKSRDSALVSITSSTPIPEPAQDAPPVNTAQAQEYANVSTY